LDFHYYKKFKNPPGKNSKTFIIKNLKKIASSWVSDDAKWMLAKFKSLDDSAFPQQFAPIAGRFLTLSHWRWRN
jgi:hypothetical protein